MAQQEQSGGKQARLLLGSGTYGFGHGADPNVGKDTQFKPGQSGNPAGRPKGRRSLSSVIQDLLNDERFIERLSSKVKDINNLPDEEFQGTPMKAIISTALVEAMSPNSSYKARAIARDWIAKYGYGTKIDMEIDDRRANPYSELSADELRKLAQEQ